MTEQSHTDANEGDSFFGQHFEGLGNVWAALFGDPERVRDVIPVIVQDGRMAATRTIASNGGELEIAFFAYPPSMHDASVGAGALFARETSAEGWTFYSCYPIFSGLPNPLTIEITHTWENGAEGVVSARRAGGGPPAEYFDPLYFREQSKLIRGSEHTVYLSALALRIEKAEPQEMTIETGPFYEMELEKFLRENPGKEASDFTAPTIRLEGARILFPTDYATELMFQCPVLAVERLSLFGAELLQIKVVFAGEDGEEIGGYLYAPEYMLNGYTPQIGDDVTGVMWMTGYTDREILRGNDAIANHSA